MDALGINIVSIVIYTVLFVLVYLVLNKYLVKRIIEILEKRQLTVKENFVLKASLEKQNQQLEQQKKDTFTATKAEAEKTMAQVLKGAHTEKAKILEEAQQEAQEIIEKAEKFLENERTKLSLEMTDKVKTAAQKVVEEVYQTNKLDIDRKLIDKAISELNS